MKTNPSSAPGNPNDSELIQKAQNGDSKAFEQLMNAHLKKLYFFAFSIIRNSAIASDIAQEVFIILYDTLKMKKYNPAAIFVGWLKRTARNKIKDLVKKRTVATISMQAHHDIITNESDETPFPDERWQPVSEAISTLPEEERTLLNLRFWEDLSWKDVATPLDTNENAARCHSKRIIKKLKKKLNKK